MSLQDQNLYYKDGKKYKPIGLSEYDRTAISDGIYYVRHFDYSTSSTNLSWLQGLYKISDVPSHDLPMLCSLHNYTEYILNHEKFRDYLRGKTFTWAELVALIIAIINEKNTKTKEEK